jgi:hypothetical protein
MQERCSAYREARACDISLFCKAFVRAIAQRVPVASTAAAAEFAGQKNPRGIERRAAYGSAAVNLIAQAAIKSPAGDFSRWNS